MKEKKDKTLLYLVVGPSGSGKDTFCNIFRNLEHCNVISSFTTRPMREGEFDGREHTFISEEMFSLMDRKKMLAYTFYGGYHYFTSPHQIKKGYRNFYIIDEYGANELIRLFGGRYTVKVIEMQASEETIRRRKVEQGRTMRDEEREPLMLIKPDYVINNDSGKRELFDQILSLFPWSRTLKLKEEEL